MGTQKSESILILVIEKESKTLEKISNGKVCSVTARNPLHAELHTRSGLSVVTDIILASMGLLARRGHSYKQKEKTLTFLHYHPNRVTCHLQSVTEGLLSCLCASP